MTATRSPGWTAAPSGARCQPSGPGNKGGSSMENGNIEILVANQPSMEPPEGLGGRLEPERLGAGRVDPGCGERRRRRQRAEADGGPARQPVEGARRVEQVVEHLATGLAEQRVVGTRGLDQR